MHIYTSNCIIIGSGNDMSRRLFNTKPLPEPMLIYCLLEPEEKNFSKILIKIILIQQNIFENVVCEMSAILLQPQCVKTRQGTVQYIQKIQGLHPSNERRPYKVTPYLIGWAHT